MKQHFYKSFGKQYGLLYILNHSTLSQSELIRVFFISYDSYKRNTHSHAYFLAMLLCFFIHQIA